MGAVAGSTIAAIIGTVEILKLRVRMVDVEMELAATIGTLQKSGEHVLFCILNLI